MQEGLLVEHVGLDLFLGCCNTSLIVKATLDLARKFVSCVAEYTQLVLEGNLCAVMHTLAVWALIARVQPFSGNSDGLLLVRQGRLRRLLPLAQSLRLVVELCNFLLRHLDSRIESLQRILMLIDEVGLGCRLFARALSLHLGCLDAQAHAYSDDLPRHRADACRRTSPLRADVRSLGGELPVTHRRLRLRNLASSAIDIKCCLLVGNVGGQGGDRSLETPDLGCFGRDCGLKKHNRFTKLAGESVDGDLDVVAHRLRLRPVGTRGKPVIGALDRQLLRYQRGLCLVHRLLKHAEFFLCCSELS
mmetsp:Transcript_4712/g.15195  ORF Transcript_4712/g.15195 Transcript_4712/m.15195 type:complete len:304 (+) Transcript_4712:512-1423(+)